MSQSKEHEILIQKTLEAISLRFKDLHICSDIQHKPGDLVPPKIGEFRPDIYAARMQEITIIAECKTDRDVDNKHTEGQILSFVKYLGKREGSMFILSTNGHRADLAKTVLYFVRKRIDVQFIKTSLEVFDTCDFWRLDKGEDFRWHLI